MIRGRLHNAFHSVITGGRVLAKAVLSVDARALCLRSAVIFLVVVFAIVKISAARVLPDEVESSEEIMLAVGHSGTPQIKGLEQRGFYDLAKDQLLRTRENHALPERVRIEATYFLADLYVKLGDKAGGKLDLKTKLEYYKNAVAEYSRYLEGIKGKLSEEEEADVRFSRGKALEALAMDSGESYQLVVEKEDKAAYKKEAVKWFGMAAVDFDLSARVFKERRKHWEKKASSTKEKEKFWHFRDRSAHAMAHRSWTYYHYSKLYDGPAETEAMAEKLNTALAEFQKLAGEYRLFLTGMEATRGAGLCYLYLKDYARAVEMFDQVLNARRDRNTKKLLRFSRYNLAMTYNSMGGKENAEKARLEISLLLSDLDREQRLEKSMRDLQLAAALEDARALLALAGAAREKWLASEKLKKKKEAKDFKDQCTACFMRAKTLAENVARDRKSHWRRNGERLLAEIMGSSKEVLGKELPRRLTIHECMSQAQRLLDEKKLLEAKAQFEKAIEVGNERLYGRTLIPEAWYKIGLIYYQLPKYLPASEVDTNYSYYYEAGTVFEHIAKDYPDADGNFAAEAANTAQQFFGALFKARKKMQKPVRLDAERYYRALALFANRFPEHPAARFAKLQSAKLAMNVGNYTEAGSIFESLKMDDEGFLEGSYMAGHCFWIQALKEYEENGGKAASAVIENAAKALAGYGRLLEWYTEYRTKLSTERLFEANRWVAKTKVAMGKLYVHPASGRIEDALAVLRNFEDEHVKTDRELMGRLRRKPAAEPWKDGILPEMLFVRISAYRLKNDLAAAEREAEDIFKRFGSNPISVTAAKLVGLAYFQEREKLLKKEPADERKIQEYTTKYSRWFGIAIEKDPDQSIGAYVSLAAGLLDLKEYNEAESILIKGKTRFKEGISKEDEQRFLTLLQMIAVKKEDWEAVKVRTNALLAEKRNRYSIDYWRDLATAYENLGEWDKSVTCWRRVKYITENAKGEQYLEAKRAAIIRLANAYCHLPKPDKDRAFRIVMFAISGDEGMMRTAPSRDMVLKFFKENLPDKTQALEPYVGEGGK